MKDLPAPLEVPWTMKPLSSAKTALERLDDGRMYLTIDHDVLHGVTPEMLVWWFENIEGDMDLEGRRVSRYRVWHPLDHVAYHRPAPRVFHIHEVFGRDPRHTIDVLTDVSRLDLGGFRHHPRLYGLSPVVMDYTFERVAGGTRYRNSLTVGYARAPRAVNRLLVRAGFSEAHGAAWLKHNVEEVGNFEFFLPKLFAAHR